MSQLDALLKKKKQLDQIANRERRIKHAEQDAEIEEEWNRAIPVSWLYDICEEVVKNYVREEINSTDRSSAGKQEED